MHLCLFTSVSYTHLLDKEDILSYQDSFKWYDYDKEKAYNYKPASYSHYLDTTEYNLDGEDVYKRQVLFQFGLP